jgi:hypothetical protein
MAFLMHVLFCLSDVSLQRYESADFGPILKKTLFHTGKMYTVTQDKYELRKAAHVFDWWWGVEGGPAYVGWPRIKRSSFLKLFLESQNHIF